MPLLGGRLPKSSTGGEPRILQGPGEYRECRAAKTIPPPEELYQDDKASWWSKEGRVQRRVGRWEKRAKRIDGTDQRGKEVEQFHNYVRLMYNSLHVNDTGHKIVLYLTQVDAGITYEPVVITPKSK